MCWINLKKISFFFYFEFYWYIYCSFFQIDFSYINLTKKVHFHWCIFVGIILIFFLLHMPTDFSFNHLKNIFFFILSSDTLGLFSDNLLRFIFYNLLFFFSPSSLKRAIISTKFSTNLLTSTHFQNSLNVNFLFLTIRL